MYADYSYYSGTYGGTIVPETNWNAAAGKSSDRMDAATFGRLASGVPAAWDTQVKRCCCELAELYYSYVLLPTMQSENGQPVAAETNSTYSVTYRSAADTSAALLYGSGAGLENLVQAVLAKHLGRTGLLFRGCADVYE